MMVTAYLIMLMVFFILYLTFDHAWLKNKWETTIHLEKVKLRYCDAKRFS